MTAFLAGRPHRKLIEAWLDELGLLNKLKEEATADERAVFVARGETAAKLVDENFTLLQREGRLSELSVAYKARRAAAQASGKRIKPWSAYLFSEKIKAVRAMARAQRARARRGIPAL